MFCLVNGLRSEALFRLDGLGRKASMREIILDGRKVDFSLLACIVRFVGAEKRKVSDATSKSPNGVQLVCFYLQRRLGSSQASPSFLVGS